MLGRPSPGLAAKRSRMQATAGYINEPLQSLLRFSKKSHWKASSKTPVETSFFV